VGPQPSLVDDPFIFCGGLERVVDDLDPPLHIAAHVCGQLVREDVGEVPGDLTGKVGLGEQPDDDFLTGLENQGIGRGTRVRR
jgi:hypothetical protein